MAERWHALPEEAVVERLAVDPATGLDHKAWRQRLTQVGPNRLTGEEGPVWPAILLAQFKDFMVLVLLGAALLSWALAERADAVTIIAIVMLNALLGFVQEYRAERSLEALRRCAAPHARVLRAGNVQVTPADEVVPGDVLLLEAGDRVPADARLLEAVQVQAEEAALTGESLPVKKRADGAVAPDAGLGDRWNMVFMGAVLTRGRARAVAVATGMQTEMGRIAGLISQTHIDATPLQRRLAQLGRWLVAGCAVICALVVGLGLLTGESLHMMILTGISLGVAAIPEGLPAIVTVALALGVQRMIRYGAIVRRLQAVETLGCATVICADKTGTLTRNEMMAQAVWTAERVYHVEGEGYGPHGRFVVGDAAVDPAGEEPLLHLTAAAALCCNARLEAVSGEQRRQVVGDPTEGALLVLAERAGRPPAELTARHRRLWEAPFEAERRRMAVAVAAADAATVRLAVKGAPDAVLERCSTIWLGGERRLLTPGLRQQVMAAAQDMAADALRVLAVADQQLSAAPGPEADPDQVERDLCLLGLVGMTDPPRPEAAAAIAAAARAGVRTVMITGDHPATALAIARGLGLAGPADRAVTGAELNTLGPRAMTALVARARVFARVTPEHKLRIVRELRARGEVVAMTGDGVNDAPAVKEADIGVAMGRTGTDVTREAAAMVLSDDNYATIVAAVREGRAIYDNIRRFVRYLLSCNIGEVLLMFAAALLRLPLPLLPIQILWVNLVTDGLPAMALGLEPAERDVMRRRPRPPGESIFARRLGLRVLGRGLLIGLGSLVVFVWALGQGPAGDAATLAKARTMAFATLVAAQLIHVFDCRARRSGAWSDLAANPFLPAAVAVSTCLLLVVIYWPPLAMIFRAVPLGAADWLAVLAVSAAAEVVVAVRRLLAA